MSLKNLLDLRKKDIQIIERIIFKKRPFHKELLLILAVIGVASGTIWGISKADNIIENRQVTDKGFSAIGIVSNITDTEISIVDAKGTNKEETSYTLSTISVNKIETKDYQPLALLDIKVGDRVILQGRQTKEGDIIIGRIISFGLANLPKEETATSTATTTESTSTTTDTQASSTDTSATPSSPSIIQTIKDTITDTISNIVDTITGTSSGTTTEEVASSTEATTTDTTTPEATTTESTPSPEPVPTPKAEAPTEQQPEQQTQQESLPSPAPPVTESTN